MLSGVVHISKLNTFGNFLGYCGQIAWRGLTYVEAVILVTECWLEMISGMVWLPNYVQEVFGRALVGTCPNMIKAFSHSLLCKMSTLQNPGRIPGARAKDDQVYMVERRSTCKFLGFGIDLKKLAQSIQKCSFFWETAFPASVTKKNPKTIVVFLWTVTWFSTKEKWLECWKWFKMFQFS